MRCFEKKRKDLYNANNMQNIIHTAVSIKKIGIQGAGEKRLQFPEKFSFYLVHPIIPSIQ